MNTAVEKMWSEDVYGEIIHIGNTDSVEDFFWNDEYIDLLGKKDDSKVQQQVYWNEQEHLRTLPQEKEKTS